MKRTDDQLTELTDTELANVAGGELSAAVRFIIASVSFSTTWLMALALPVTSNPPTNRITIIFRL